MKANFYKIKCITNMHMGSGDINFNIIDNEVQRDPITGFPTMFSSGVKGAFREHFEKCEAMAKETTDIFGSAKGDSSTPGKLKFLSGSLLFLPVRASKGNQAYCMVTTKTMLNQFNDLYRTITGDSYIAADLLDSVDMAKTYGKENVEVDGIKTENKEMNNQQSSFLKALLGGDVEKAFIMTDSDMKSINLPVLARNQLENGISQNLWYEEVVPHEAIFYTAVLSDGTESGDKALDDFDKYISENNLVQFGGNASIGYGLTQIERLNKEAE